MTEIATSSTETDETTEGSTSGTPEQENGSEVPKGNREARYRVERNEARAERDSLTERVAQLQTRELERIAAASLSNPADLLALSGKTLADFLGEDGELDAEAIAEAAREVVATRPGLHARLRYVDPSQGSGNDRPRKTELSFNDLFKS